MRLESPARRTSTRLGGPWLPTLLAGLALFPFRLQAESIPLDGVVADERGKPIARATVVDRVMGPVRRARLPEISDEAGRLALDKVPSPDFGLLLRAPGFSPHFQEEIEAPHEATGPELDLGTIVLQPGLTFRGLIVDPSGRPVAGASIVFETASSLGSFWLLGHPVAGPRTRSGPDGSFEIRDLSSDGSVHLEVEKEGYERMSGAIEPPPEGELARVVLKPIFHLRGAVRDEAGRPVPGADLGVWIIDENGTAGGEEWGPRATSDEDGRFELAGSATGRLRLRAEATAKQGRTLDLDVREPRDREGLNLVLFTGAVRLGRVTERGGEPLEEVWIHLNEESWDPVRIAAPRATTGADGRFRLEGLMPGIWRISALAEGWVRSSRVVEIRPGENQAELKLERKVEGSLSIAGRVLDPEGQPASRAEVSFACACPSNGISTQTGDDGTFARDDLVPGSYQVKATHDRFASSKALRLELPGGPATELELHLLPGGGLSGRVAGAPAGRLAEVTVRAEHSSMELNIRAAPVSSNGDYRFDDLDAGEWRVEAKLDQCGVRATAIVGGVDTTTVLDLDLPMREALEGRVLFSGQPVAGASVRVVAADRCSSGKAKTGQAGEFRIEGLEAGTYGLHVTYGNPNGILAQQIREVSIPAAGELRIELPSPP